MNMKLESGETMVIAVILTYNRKDLLARSLAAVMAQTRPCNQVLVVDNASEDGTTEMLQEVDYPSLTAYRLSCNRGAAGGFNAGFRLAYQHGADLVWMMDDDVIPEPDALKSLLDAGNRLCALSVPYSFLISTAFSENGAVTNTPIISLKKNRIGYRNWPALLMYGLMPIERASFVSILVPRVALGEHGLPLSELFIWGEDSDFTLRISRKCPGYLVGSSRVVHLRQEAGPLSIMRETNTARLEYFKKYYRNNIFIAKSHYPAHHYPIAILKVLWTSGRLLARRKPRLAMMLLKSIWESIGFSPTPQPVDSSIESLDPCCKVVGKS